MTEFLLKTVRARST